MQLLQLVKGLNENFLYEQVIRNIHIFERVFKESLYEYNNGKRVIIIMDHGLPQRRLAPMLALGYYIAARNLGMFPKFVNISNRPVTKEFVEALLKISEDSIFILSLTNKLLFNDPKLMPLSKIVKIKKHKRITCTGLGAVKSNYFQYYINVSNVNFMQMHKKGMFLKDKLDKGNKVRIITKQGTDIIFSIKNREAISNDGYYKNNNGGNMPVGEVFIAPVEDKTEGKIVIDGSIRTIDKTFLIKNPITLFIKNGRVIEIQGGEGARLLENTLRFAEQNSFNKEGVRIIGELGIGINPKATISGPTIVNEKSLGTFHVAIGSNWYFGGKNKTNIHIDQVVKNPEIRIDNEKIVLKRV